MLEMQKVVWEEMLEMLEMLEAVVPGLVEAAAA